MAAWCSMQYIRTIAHYCALIMLIMVARRLPRSLALQCWFIARSQRCTKIVQWSPVSPKHPSCAKCQRRLWCIRGANTCVQDDVSSSKLCWNTRGKRWQQLLALWEDLSHLALQICGENLFGPWTSLGQVKWLLQRRHQLRQDNLSEKVWSIVEWIGSCCCSNVVL